MVKLSREMVITRVKLADLGKVRELNICGRYLDDVSILEEMPALEILVLSVNDIKTLKHFSNCINLKTLFLRKNLICELREVQYLKPLRKLTNLSFEDNPIVTACGPNYRSSILRILPNLELLDGLTVTDEERVCAVDMNDVSPKVPLPAVSSSRQQERETLNNFDYCQEKESSGQCLKALNCDLPFLDESKHRVKSQYFNVVSATFCLLREMDVETLNAVDDIIKDLREQRLCQSGGYSKNRQRQ